MKTRKLAVALIAGLTFLQLSCSLSQVRFPSQPVVIYGDTRTNHATHRKIVEAIMDVGPAAVFHTGDLVGKGLEAEQWVIFNEIASELMETTEFYPALGNHEENSPLYFDNFELPNNERWYVVEKNNIHFIILDSNSDLSEDSEQYQWFEADLRNIGEEIKFVIAVLHHPPFSTGPHGDDEKVMALREILVPLFEQYGVDMVFAGHDHFYERSLYNNIYYIVSGGGGAPLYGQKRRSPHSQLFIKTYHFCALSVRDNRLIVNVFDRDLRLIDQFKVARKR